MNIGVTELVGEYPRCKRRWFLGSRNRAGLQRIVSAPPLVLGTLVHAALAEWLDNTNVSLPQSFAQHASIAQATAIETFKKQTGYAPSDTDLLPIHDSIVQGISMMENYALHWKQPLPPDFTLIAPEQHVSIPIPNTEHHKEWLLLPNEEALPQDCMLLESEPTLNGYMFRVYYAESRLHYLEGRLDGIIKDKRGRLYVLEHKTYGNRPREEVLRTNSQFTAYQWLLSHLDLGYPVAGIAYDGLWKRAAPPKTVDGRSGTLSDLFIRMRIEKSPEELAEFEQAIALEALDIASSPPSHLNRPNRTSDGSCHWGCGYEELCLAMSRGEDTEYVLRTKYTAKPPYAENAAAEKNDE